MALRRICVCAAFVFFFQYSHAQVVSDFATNADGWTAPGALAGSFNYVSSGGNPGGYITGQTPGSIPIGAGLLWVPFFYEAPTKFEGDKSAYYGGNLRYDATQTTTGPGVDYSQVVMTTNAGVSLWYYPAPPVVVPAFGTWINLDVQLSAATGFWKTANSSTGPAATEAQIRATLADIATLQIRGLFRNANVASRIDNVTMYPPIIIDTHPSSSFLCEGPVVTMSTTASNNPNITYQWQMLDPVVGWIDLANGGGYTGATTNNLEINTAGGFGSGNYRAVISGTAVDDAITFSANLTVGARPDAPTTTGASSCDEASLTLTAAGGTVEQYRWYSVESGGTAISGETSEKYVTPELESTTTFYVAISGPFGNFTCESTRTPVVAHIGPPSPPTTIGAASCTPSTIILTANGGLAGQYRWYTQQTGGIAIANENGKTYVTPSLSATTSYYVAIDNGDCESSRAAVVATIGGQSCGPTSNSILEIFNAVSPNKDGKNDGFFIRNIDTLTDAMKNHVKIFNRWGDMVWEGNNYNNTTVVFTGLSKNNTELPSGTYYYKIEFLSPRATESGYLVLKR